MEKWIEEARIEMLKNDISVTKLAKEIGLERTYVNKILRGTINPKKSKVCAENIRNAIQSLKGAQ